MSEATTDVRGERQLRRLETLTDVVYAIVLWRMFMLIPRPGVGDEKWTSVRDYLADEWIALALIAIGVAFTIIYWLQSNHLLSALKRTDTRHTALSIVQLFFVLIFLYSLRLGVDLGGSVGTRLVESCAAAAVGLTAVAAWNYARKGHRLLRPEVSTEEAQAIAKRITAEPATAIATIPMAFLGAVFWELTWFLYPVLARWLRLPGGDEKK